METKKASTMTSKPILNAIIKGHEADMSSMRIAEKLGISCNRLNYIIRKHKLTRRALGLPGLPKCGDNYVVETKIPSKMTEDEIAALYAGRKYDSLPIKSSGIAKIIPHHEDSMFTASSMNF